jgi:hypothetical protein
MVTGNEVSALVGLKHPCGVFVRGNSKPVTTFAEPGHFYNRPRSCFALRNTSRNMAGVSFPVDVFCWLG